MKKNNSRPASYFDKPSMNIHKLLAGAGVSITESEKELDPEAPNGSIASVADNDQSVVYIKSNSWKPLVQTTTNLPAARIHDVYLDLPEWVGTYFSGSDYLNEIEGVEEPWLLNENSIDLGISLEVGDEINLYIQDKLIKTYWVYGVNLTELLGEALEETENELILLVGLPKPLKSLVNDPVLMLLLSLILGLEGSAGAININAESDLMGTLASLRMPLIIEGRGIASDLPAMIGFLPWQCELSGSSSWSSDTTTLDANGLKLTQWIEDYAAYRNSSYGVDLSNFCTISASYYSGKNTTSSGTIPFKDFKEFPHEVTIESMGSHLSYNKNYLKIEKDKYEKIRGINLEAVDFVNMLDRITELEQLVKTE